MRFRRTVQEISSVELPKIRFLLDFVVSASFREFYLSNRTLSRPRTKGKVVRSVLLDRVVIVVYFFEPRFDS